LQANSASALVYVAGALRGSGGAQVMALALALSVVATTGTGIVLTARIVYGMAAYRALPPFLGTISRRFATPVAASITVACSSWRWRGCTCWPPACKTPSTTRAPPLASTDQKRTAPLTTTTPVLPLAALARSGPAPAPGLPRRQGAVLAVLWDAPRPLSAGQISARLTDAGTGIYHALHQLRATGLITTTGEAGRAHHYQATIGRDDYLAALVAAVLDQAADPAAVLRTALHTPASGP
jgi:predicted transcriptional regulator